MKKGLKKFTKGMLAIFTIKLLAFGIIFLNQSCNNNESLNPEIPFVKKNFLESLKRSKDDFSKVKVIESKDYFVANNLERTTNNLVELELTRTDHNLQIEISNFNNVIDLINSGDLEMEEGGCPKDSQELCAVIYTDENEVSNSLSPSIESAKSYLHAHGYNSDDIIEILDGEDESMLVPLVASFTAFENQTYSNINKNIDFSDLFFIQKSYAMYSIQPSTTVQCAVEAIGLDVIYSIASEGIEKAGKKGLKKAIKKIASKFLGPVGVGIAVAEFAWCMYVNSNSSPNDNQL